MTKKLRKLLETIVTGNHDLLQETVDAARIILAGGYEGYEEDVEYIEGVETGFELESLLSQGKWYWQNELRMERLLEKAEAYIEEEIEENTFIEHTDIIGWESRYLDNLAFELAYLEILGDDIYDREDKYDLYEEFEDEILELTDKLLEAIEEKIMTKYNCYEDSIYLRVYYKIDKKFETRDECLDFFEIDY